MGANNGEYEGKETETSKRLISGLVLSRDLSPRTRIGSNHVRQLAEALKSGATLPPIVIERRTSRVVDGFHRVEAYRRVYGSEALIEVIARAYKSDGELFVHAIELNSHHGQRLASYDQLRCVTIAKELSIDYMRLAGALSVRPAYIGEFSKRRTGSEMGTRAPVALKRTIEHMRGRELTPNQVEANQKLGGQSQSFYVNQLTLLIEHNLLDTEDANLMQRLGYLQRLLEETELQIERPSER